MFVSLKFVNFEAFFAKSFEVIKSISKCSSMNFTFLNDLNNISFKGRLIILSVAILKLFLTYFFG